MEETGVLVNPALLGLVLPDFEPSRFSGCLVPQCFSTYGSGDQAIRRLPGGKQTTEIAAGSLARPSDKPHYPLYLLYLLSLHAGIGTIQTKGTGDGSGNFHHFRPSTTYSSTLSLAAAL